MEDFLTEENRHTPKDSLASKWAEEMAQRLRALPVLTEEPSSVPRTHIKQLTVAQGNLTTLASSGTCIHSHTQLIKNNKTNFFKSLGTKNVARACWQSWLGIWVPQRALTTVATP